MQCKHLEPEEKLCLLASKVAGKPINIEPATCRACQRTEHPSDLNEVILAIAGVDTSLEEGPGTSLAKLLSWFVAKPEGCNCPNRVHVMNAWGGKRCLEELPTILSWLRESALDNDYPYSEFVISTIVKAICKRHM